MSDTETQVGSEEDTQTETDSKGNQSGAVTEERAKRKAAQEEIRRLQEQQTQMQTELDALRNQKINPDENESKGLNISEEDIYNPQSLQAKMDAYVTAKIDEGLNVARAEVQRELTTRDLNMQMKQVRDGIELFQDETFGRYATEILENRVATAQPGTLNNMDDYQEVALEVAKELSSLKANQSEKNESKEGEFEPTKPTSSAGGEVTQLKPEEGEKRTWNELMSDAKEYAGKFSAKWHAERNQG